MRGVRAMTRHTRVFPKTLTTNIAAKMVYCKVTSHSLDVPPSSFTAFVLGLDVVKLETNVVRFMSSEFFTVS